MAGFLGGKVLAQWLIFAALGIVSLLSGKFLIGAEIRGAVLAVLWIAACGGAMYMLLMLLNTFCSNQRGATMLSNLLVMTLGMLGGCFFPFELMPNSLTRIGRWAPNAWALLRFKDILAGHADPARLAAAFGAVLGLTALLFAAGAWRLRWRFLS
jgi:ABC-2 type transport system permease protein